MRLAAYHCSFGEVVAGERPAAFGHGARDACGCGHAHSQAFADYGVEVFEVLRVVGSGWIFKVGLEDL